MALTKLSTILRDADSRGTAVIGFDCYNYESIAWYAEVGEELGLPIIVMLYPGMLNYISAEAFAAITKAVAKKVKIPVVLHLDHCDSLDTIMAAIKAGFTSVMIDGSKLEFEENIRVTSKVVKAAHALGVDVEAELGKVGMAAKRNDYKNPNMYTTPEQAADFTNRTKVDALAIAIGNAHGYYIETPKLDMSRLKKINKAVDTPLVLHGGTGIPDDQLIQAFKLGMNKLNVGTEYFALFYKTMKDYQKIRDKEDSLFTFWEYQKKAVQDYLRAKMLLTIH